jgi:hypothetical protein
VASTSEREPRDLRVARVALGVIAAVLVVSAATLPVWESRLDVLQYPGQQLVLTAYADRLTGDVAEITNLNHYVGLKIFDMADLQETILWWPGLAAALAGVIVATLIPRRHPGTPAARFQWAGMLARIGLWLFPIGILLDIQFRLYQLGHSMNPGAAFRQPPFTPPVVGAAQVSSNVHMQAWPGTAVVCLLLAAFLMTFGLSLYVFVKQLLGVGPAPEGLEDEATATASAAG